MNDREFSEFYAALLKRFRYGSQVHRPSLVGWVLQLTPDTQVVQAVLAASFLIWAVRDQPSPEYLVFFQQLHFPIGDIRAVRGLGGSALSDLMDLKIGVVLESLAMVIERADNGKSQIK